MNDLRRIGAKQYFDYLPDARHQCGDIWMRLPTFGTVRQPFVSGLIVTPACDLSNRKSETLTYLPIVSIRSYFSSRSVVPLYKKKAQGALKAAGIQNDIDWEAKDYRTPPVDVMIKTMSEATNFLAAKRRGDNDIKNTKRAIGTIQALIEISKNDGYEIATDLLEVIMGSELEPALTRMVTNSYSSDLHFLPKDEQDLLYSGVPQHSLVLFRYPMTVPIIVLDLALEANDLSWSEVKSSNIGSNPNLAHYSDLPPVKTQCLTKSFLSDVLSRYVNIFNRMGSPDFTQATISKFVREVRE